MSNLELRNNIVYLKSVDSTNDYANRLIKKKGADEGTVILAEFQNQGKGQRGNFWESEAGKNLTFSFILRPRSLPAQKQFYLSMAVSLGIIRFFESEKIEAFIKWPNDIYVGRKKIAGILIENSLNRDTIDYSVIGIGLNVNQEKFLSDAPNPTSILLEKNIVSEPDNVLDKLLTVLELQLRQLYENKLELLRDNYLRYLMLRGKLSTFIAGGCSFEGEIINVNEAGELVLQLKDGAKKSFGFKEIVFPY